MYVREAYSRLRKSLGRLQRCLLYSHAGQLACYDVSYDELPWRMEIDRPSSKCCAVSQATMGFGGPASRDYEIRDCMGVQWELRAVVGGTCRKMVMVRISIRRALAKFVPCASIYC